MKLKKSLLVLALMTCTFVAFSQTSEVGKIAFSGDKTVAQLVESLYADSTLEEGQTVKISVHVPVRKQGELSQSNLDGFPQDLSKDSALSINVPFSSTDYINEYGDFDVAKMGEKIDQVFSLLIPNQYNKDVLNSKGCGGYPVGTTITDTKTYGCLGTITNVYECQVHNGQANWYIISSTMESGSCMDP